MKKEYKVKKNCIKIQHLVRTRIVSSSISIQEWEDTLFSDIDDARILYPEPSNYYRKIAILE